MLPLLLTAPLPAAAADSPPELPNHTIPQAPVGFSKLIVRLEGQDEIGIAGSNYEVQLIEHMRARGFRAVGAENLVFGKDESRTAEYLVGGTVRELACLQRASGLGSPIGVEWQLLDVARDSVIYSVVSRAVVLNVSDSNKKRMAAQLLTAAMDKLVERDRFRRALASAKESPKASDPTFATASFAKCASGKKLPEGAEDLLRATVVVKTKDGFGSGFFITSDGLVVTAAHVVDGTELTLRLREGNEVAAVPVRVARSGDVALLRTTKPLSGHACVAVRPEDPPVGTEVYAAGAPGSLSLAFSLTRGIVSGIPEIDGRRRIQTDAPVSPGNSGGPLADAEGNVLGVVSFKLAGGKVEGLAFAAPIRDALTALGLQPAESTDARLTTEIAASTTPTKVALFNDEPDSVPSLDPEADRARALVAEEARRRADERARETERSRLTPMYVPLLRAGGVIVAVSGLVMVLKTYSDYDSSTTTERSFNSLRTMNTIGWGAIGVGVAGLAASFFIVPPLPAVKTGKTSAVRLGVGSIQWEGTF